ncbi:MAG: hypothetical protein HY898_26915 [Deltaproteobacteria bacterium]|nr:hypothetical protein [Deltaproteobacteria bacterium]
MHRRLVLLLSLTVVVVAAACSGARPAPPNLPPPEYEPARPFDIASAQPPARASGSGALPPVDSEPE